MGYYRGPVSQVEQDLFWLAFVLIVVVYWVGSTNVINSSAGALGNLGNVFTGRNQAGQFASYPANG